MSPSSDFRAREHAKILAATEGHVIDTCIELRLRLRDGEWDVYSADMEDVPLDQVEYGPNRYDCEDCADPEACKAALVIAAEIPAPTPLQLVGLIRRWNINATRVYAEQLKQLVRDGDVVVPEPNPAYSRAIPLTPAYGDGTETFDLDGFVVSRAREFLKVQTAKIAAEVLHEIGRRYDRGNEVAEIAEWLTGVYWQAGVPVSPILFTEWALVQIFGDFEPGFQQGRAVNVDVELPAVFHPDLLADYDAAAAAEEANEVLAYEHHALREQLAGDPYYLGDAPYAVGKRFGTPIAADDLCSDCGHEVGMHEDGDNNVVSLADFHRRMNVLDEDVNVGRSAGLGYYFGEFLGN